MVASFTVAVCLNLQIHASFSILKTHVSSVAMGHGHLHLAMPQPHPLVRADTALGFQSPYGFEWQDSATHV